MHQIWDQDHRDREVCEDAVRTLDQGQETELGDGEIYNAANQGCKDLVAGDLSLRRFAWCFSRILRPKQFSFCQHIRLRFRCRSSSPSQPPY